MAKTTKRPPKEKLDFRIDFGISDSEGKAAIKYIETQEPELDLSKLARRAWRFYMKHLKVK